MSTEVTSTDQQKRPTMVQLKRSLAIFSYIKPYRWTFFFGFVCLIASTVTFMLIPGIAGEMANAAQDKSAYSLEVSQYLWVFVAVLLVQSIFSYGRTIYFAIVSEKSMADIRKYLYEKIICQPIYFFEENRIGELSSRLTTDVEQLQAALSVNLAEFMRQVVTLIVGIAILTAVAPRLSITMLASVPIVVVLAMLFGRYIRKLSKSRQTSLATSNTIIQESLQAITSVKSFANEQFENLRYGTSIHDVVKISLRYARTRGLFFVFLIMGMFGAILFVLWRGAILVEQGEMPLGNLLSFIIYTGIIGGAIAGFGSLYTALAASVGATERILDIMDMETEFPLPLDDVKPVSIDGKIEFNDVRFAYPSRPEIDVLKNIKLEVASGETIALVGPSGAGKSTIAQLIMLFYHPSAGKITIDGKDIQSYNLRALRNEMAFVPQELILFGGSIAENIRYGKPDASLEEIKRAADEANALAFIEGFPEGFDTIVGDRGIKLSGGQKQRIAIARAILKNPTILLLDEATSALDAESEHAVQEALQRLMQNRSSVVIAHRLSTIRNADTIYVIDEGRIVEAGKHDELLSRSDGLYAKLVNLQLENA